MSVREEEVLTRDELREWMTTHNFSVHGLARALGVWPTTVERWRSGSRKVPRSLRWKLVVIALSTEAPNTVAGQAAIREAALLSIDAVSNPTRGRRSVWARRNGRAVPPSQ